MKHRPEPARAPSEPYRVIQRLGWSYIVGEPATDWSGPWRYQWEAEEYAEKLNAARSKDTGGAG